MTRTRNASCPRCSTVLVSDRIEEAVVSVETLRCSVCEGRFFEEGQLEKIDDIVEPRLVEIRRIPRRSDQYEELKCPICDAPPVMGKFAHERDKRVIMDVCPECRGVWLDGGELKAVQVESLPVFVVNMLKYLREVL